MHTLDQISQRTAVLPDNLQQEVLDFVEFLVAKSHSFIPKPDATTQRIAGLQRGKAQISEDFDEPLSDDFWLGKA
ncbi:MAG: DUF2281 domain-containing protein [Gammaproteobacteria bacterium]|nr:DUF2281 domain-containing protein [Gammaproteobacteria bacterium]UCG19221.1 MAG: DUF2281 domain-containing protein [Thiotrichales bacterium]